MSERYSCVTTTWYFQIWDHLDYLMTRIGMTVTAFSILTSNRSPSVNKLSDFTKRIPFPWTLPKSAGFRIPAMNTCGTEMVVSIVQDRFFVLGTKPIQTVPGFIAR